MCTKPVVATFDSISQTFYCNLLVSKLRSEDQICRSNNLLDKNEKVKGSMMLQDGADSATQHLPEEELMCIAILLAKASVFLTWSNSLLSE